MNASFYKSQFLALMYLMYPQGLPEGKTAIAEFNIRDANFRFVFDKEDYDTYKSVEVDKTKQIVRRTKTVKKKKGFSDRLTKEDIKFCKELKIAVDDANQQKTG